jgi:hypothetical protein
MFKHHLALAAIHFVLAAILVFEGWLAHSACVLAAAAVYAAMGGDGTRSDRGESRTR